jgi:DNA invertase Pin-like site-specific DNA recombinase
MKDHVQNGAAHTRYAAIYARVSTEDQGKGFSIPTQLEACRKLAAHEGYAVPESHVLIDEGISGTTLDRLGLQKLRDLARRKPSPRSSSMIPTDCLAAWAISSCLPRKWNGQG